jgi:dienelactone hydrolase
MISGSVAATKAAENRALLMYSFVDASSFHHQRPFGLHFAVYLCIALVHPTHADEITTPEALWRGIDPTSEPLDAASIQKWSEGDIGFEKLRFTSETVDGVPTRIFAIQGASRSDKRQPGVLHIHGGGQTASLDWVRYWAKRGYVCVSFDFCGPWNGRKEFTDWGKIQHANMAHANGGFQVRPTPRESSWFHWALASRRALTLLAQHPSVDADRLGIFGISVGGTLCWLAAASDARVATAVPIYGCGYNHDDRRTKWGFAPLSDELKIYKNTLSPEAYAPLIRQPLFFLDSTNDFHGPMDFAFDSLAAVQGPTRWAFTPRTNHHIAPAQARNLPLWMDWRLKSGPAFPDSPRLTVHMDPGESPKAFVHADASQPVQTVEVFYSLEDRLRAARFWRSAVVERAGEHWTASLPVVNVAKPLFAFANATYASGVCLSSKIATMTPKELSTAKATLVWTPMIAHGPNGFDHWYFTTGATDPLRDLVYCKIVADAGGDFLTMNSEVFGDPISVRLSTHLVGDPQHRGRDGDRLTFDYRGDFGSAGLEVRAIENDWSPTRKVYLAKPSNSGGASGWRTANLPTSQFQAEDGATLMNWKSVQKLELSGDAKRDSSPAFRNFHWTSTSPGQ